MSDKTKPYDIRQYLLRLAEEILRTNAEMNFRASGDKTWVGYTTEDVVREAKKLNEFVSNG